MLGMENPSPPILVRDLALPALVVLAVLTLIGGLLPLALGMPALPLLRVPYGALLGYLALCCVLLGIALGRFGQHPLPHVRSRREAALVLLCVLSGGGGLLGFLVYLGLGFAHGAAVAAPIYDKLSGPQAAAVLGLLLGFLALGGVTLGGLLHLWLARSALPRSVARFAAGGAAVAAILAGFALARGQAMQGPFGLLLFFVLGSLLTLPLGLYLGGRLLPHGAGR